MASPIVPDLPLAPSGQAPLPGLDLGGGTGAGAPSAFASLLAQAADNVTKPHEQAAAAVADFSAGNDGELHRTMLAVERGDIALKFFVSVRNRALEAYREIMHMGQ